MSYDREYLGAALVPKSNASLTGLNLAAAAAQWCGYAVMTPVNIRRLLFIVSVQTLSGLVAPVVEAKRRPTFGSASGAVSLGTLTIPTASTVGQVFYKDIAYVRLNAGEELSLEIKTQATDSGTAAGVGFFGFVAEMAPEYAGDQSNMVASA